MFLHPSWVPIFPLIAWFVTLWVLLIVWLAQGRPQYPSMEENIAYISDIAATFIKPLFIVGCVITGIGFFATVAVDGLLRRAGVLEHTGRRRTKALSICSVVGAFIGAVGLILLSIFDTERYPTLHDSFLTVFMVGVILSAIFTTAEFGLLSKVERVSSALIWSYRAKIVVLVVELVLSIAFGVCTGKGVYNPGAVLEWIIAFVFEFYLFTFWVDLHPANKVMRENGHDGSSDPQMRILNRA